MYYKSKNSQLLITTALLYQKIVGGIANKYKSEIIFINNIYIYPFKNVTFLSDNQLNNIVMKIQNIQTMDIKTKEGTRGINYNEKTL